MKRRLIILVIILVTFFLIGIYYAFNNNKSKNIIKSTSNTVSYTNNNTEKLSNKENIESSTTDNWSNIYLEELKKDLKIRENLNENEKYNVDLYNNAKDINIQMLQLSKSTIPVMILSYNQDNKERITIYQVYNNSNKLKHIANYYPSIRYVKNSKVSEQYDNLNCKIEFLYNIETKEYKWYIHESDLDNYRESYIDLQKQCEIERSDINKKNEAKLYKNLKYQFSKGDLPQENVEEISEFERKFIKIDIPEKAIIHIENLKDLSENEINNYIKTLTEKYKSDVNDNLITKEIQDMVKDTISKNEKRIKNQKKLLKEEAKKDSFKVGNNTIKYGVYIGYPEHSQREEKVIINKYRSIIIFDSESSKPQTLNYIIKDNCIETTTRNYKYQIINDKTLKIGNTILKYQE